MTCFCGDGMATLPKWKPFVKVVLATKYTTWNSVLANANNVKIVQGEIQYGCHSNFASCGLGTGALEGATQKK